MTTPMRRNRARNTLSFVEKVRQSYFEWLCEMVGDVEEGGDVRPFLLSLHLKEYRWKLPNDDNRAEDGIKLRKLYQEDNLDVDCECLEGPCTVFEMLIGLAYRANFILNPDNNAGLVSKFFWEMISNLGLEPYGECEPELLQQKAYHNESKIYRFLERDYAPSGRGGLFPLKHPPTDQRETEIWYQMMPYLDENYHPA